MDLGSVCTTVTEHVSGCTVAGVRILTVEQLSFSWPKSWLRFRERRLAHAHRMLVSPRFGDRKIVDIALDCGFGDISYFNRSFRARYGATPSDVRRSAWFRGRS